jgi:hypothetical protein
MMDKRKATDRKLYEPFLKSEVVKLISITVGMQYFYLLEVAGDFCVLMNGNFMISYSRKYKILALKVFRRGENF